MGYIEDIRAVVGHRPSIWVGVAVLVLEGYYRILLQNQLTGLWGMPGGFMELAKSTEETGRREVNKATGLVIGDFVLMGLFQAKTLLCNFQWVMSFPM